MTTVRNWEIVKGCTEVNLGCDSCPSLALYREKGESSTVREMWHRLSQPRSLRHPMTLLVAHGSDLFHDNVTDDFIRAVFETIKNSPYQFFELTTKRFDRALYLGRKLEWPQNLRLGFGITTLENVSRLDCLRKIPAHYKFISACPLLEDLGKLDLSGINKVGVVRETWGPSRPVKDKWISNIEQQCKEQNIVFEETEGIMYSEELCLGE